MMNPEWLEDVFRSSLKASIYTSSIDDGPGPPQQRDPRLRKLVEGIIYSRKLILSYHLVIIALILVFSARHCFGEVLRWRRRRRTLGSQLLVADDVYDGDAVKTASSTVSKIGGDSEVPSLSGSSTLEGTASPWRKDVNEDTPLLSHGHRQEVVYPRRSITSCIKSFLMYQPGPIPLFNKTLPSNGTSFVVVAFIALNIIYTVVHINFSLFELFVLADRFGLAFAANLPLLYILAAKNQPLKVLTGVSYESLNIFHRRLGEVLCLEALLHSLGMLGVWYTLLRPTGFTFANFLFNRVILLGLGAFISYELLYVTSLASFRQRCYELFLGLHIVLQTSALVFLFFHHSGSRPYVGIALAIFLTDRLVYRLGFKSTIVVASTILMEDQETVKLSAEIVKRPGGIPSQLVGRSIKNGWQATDHVFITIHSLARKHIIQAHPFTIASRPPQSELDDMRLDLLIRARDGFSLDLLKYAQQHPTISLRVDGPYGSSHARNLLVASDLAILVAGGSGIAVVWPLVHHLLDMSRSTDTEIAPASTLRRQKIVLVWVVHKAVHIEWIGEKALAEVANMGVEIAVPTATEMAGRPDLGGMIRDMVDDWSQGTGKLGKKIGVVASGPDGMGRLVRNTCSDLVGEGRNIDVTIEKFGW